MANFSKLVELQYELRKLRVLNPSLASVEEHDIEHLGTDREIQEYYLNLMQVSLFEIAWYAHKQHQLPDDYFTRFVPDVLRVTVDDVTRVASEHINPGRLTTLVVGDYEAIDSSLRGLGLGEPALLPPDSF